MIDIVKAILYNHLRSCLLLLCLARSCVFEHVAHDFFENVVLRCDLRSSSH